MAKTDEVLVDDIMEVNSLLKLSDDVEVRMALGKLRDILIAWRNSLTK